MAIGQKYPEWWSRKKWRQPLEGLYSDTKNQGPIAKILYFTPYRAWKQWQLFPRAALYNTRNMTGDLDAVLAGNPSALRPDNLKKAWTDLWQAFFSKDKTMSWNLKPGLNAAGLNR